MELKSVEDTSWLQLFIKNSRYRRFVATIIRSTSKSLHVPMAHFIPKLQCQFA